jgi:hypothetical protein
MSEVVDETREAAAARMRPEAEAFLSAINQMFEAHGADARMIFAVLFSATASLISDLRERGDIDDGGLKELAFGLQRLLTLATCPASDLAAVSALIYDDGGPQNGRLV